MRVYGNVQEREEEWRETRLHTFDVLRHVVVNDHGNVLDVDTSTGDVGGHQDIFGSCFKVGEGELSLLLTFATVQRAGVVLRQESTGQTSWAVYIRSSVKAQQQA